VKLLITIFRASRPSKNVVRSINLITEKAVKVYTTLLDYYFVHRPSS